MKKFLCIVSMLITPKVIAIDTAYKDFIVSLLARYQRPVTILEIGSSTLCQQLYRSENVHITLMPDTIPHKLPITVLAPATISLGQLSQLAQCEHIDIVIIHELASVCQAPLASLIGVAQNLGEQVVVFTKSKALINMLEKSSMKKVRPQNTGSPLMYYSFKRKRYLTYSRFTQQHPASTPYEIQSSYTQKLFIKQEGTPVLWVPGINLVTFVMLNGIYPTNHLIKRQLLSFKQRYPQHNDLVLGNIIVQGAKLVAIDQYDTRRRVSVDHCIEVAVGVFDKDRQEDPMKWLENYYRIIKKA